jgi:TPP-dependent pyruvate/acetoin dehydrogenase alpha subunit
LVHSIEAKKNLYYKMLRLRLIEEAIAERYSSQKMRCPVHLSIGQEAVSIGVGELLDKADLAVSGHRAHGHYIGKGGSLERMIAEIYGKKTGCSSGKGGSMHLVDLECGFVGSTAIVGGTIPVGVGVAYANKYHHRKNNIVVVFLGDGAAEEGVFYESVNFAALKELPVLFLCENNFYSVYSPLKVRQPEGRKIHEMVAAMGIGTHFGDGNDILEVSSITKSAIAKIRQESKPMFLEFVTYRWREHCGPNYDNDIGYRSIEEFELWKTKDPLKRTYNQLIVEDPSFPEQWHAQQQEILREIDLAFQFAENSPFPEENDLFRDVYA